MSDYIDFGDFAREKMGMQCQYASAYVDGSSGAANLGAGLRFEGDPRDYHFLKIHKDDVDEFFARWRRHLHRMNPSPPFGSALDIG